MDNFMTNNSLSRYSRAGAEAGGNNAATTSDDIKRALMQKNYDREALLKSLKEEASKNSSGALLSTTGATSSSNNTALDDSLNGSIHQERAAASSNDILQRLLSSPYQLGISGASAALGGITGDESLAASLLSGGRSLASIGGLPTLRDAMLGSPSLMSNFSQFPLDRSGLMRSSMEQSLLGLTTNPLLQQQLDILNNTAPSVQAALQSTSLAMFPGQLGGSSGGGGLSGLSGMFSPEGLGGGQHQHQEASDRYAEHGILGPWSARSASLLGGMALSNKQEKRKTTRKKSKDKPKRPLSAYNIFFKEERNRILEKKNAKAAAAAAAAAAKGGDGDDSKTSKKSKVGFESLAKMIGQRWQNLTPDQVEYYKAEADKDMVRYKKEMEVFAANQKKKSQQMKSDAEAEEDSSKHDKEQSEDEDTCSESQPPTKRQKVEGESS